MRRRQEEALDRGREVRDTNLSHRIVLEKEREQKKRQDALLLNYALEQERAQIEAEEAKRNANRNAGKQYKMYLEQMMQKEAEDSAFVDEVCRREEERVWKQRDDALQAREDARNALQSVVEQGREEQIREKAERKLREKYEGMEFAERFIADAREGLLKEQQERDLRRQMNLDNQHLLKEHIQIRQEKSELEKQQAYLQLKEMEYMERVHQQRLQSQAGVVRLKYPIKTGPKF